MQIQFSVLARPVPVLLLCLVLAACGGGDGGATSFVPGGVGPATIAPVIPPGTDANCKP